MENISPTQILHLIATCLSLRLHLTAAALWSLEKQSNQRLEGKLTLTHYGNWRGATGGIGALVTLRDSMEFPTRWGEQASLRTEPVCPF